MSIAPEHPPLTPGTIVRIGGAGTYRVVGRATMRQMEWDFSMELALDRAFYALADVASGHRRKDAFIDACSRFFGRPVHLAYYCDAIHHVIDAVLSDGLPDDNEVQE